MPRWPALARWVRRPSPLVADVALALVRIFERFYRADESRSRASGGVGLGLAIVAAVAKAHGGAVAARSEPERGAAFTISLPLARTKSMAP
jgi:signal transduction histidine kinase